MCGCTKAQSDGGELPDTGVGEVPRPVSMLEERVRSASLPAPSEESRFPRAPTLDLREYRQKSHDDREDDGVIRVSSDLAVGESSRIISVENSNFLTTESVVPRSRSYSGEERVLSGRPSSSSFDE
jgi:hypothetical protein